MLVTGVGEVLAEPAGLEGWLDALTSGSGGLAGAIGPAILAFPLLVLGLSGFETGVSMMPLVAARSENAQLRLADRIRNTPNCSPGSWDHRPVAHTHYELTGSGHQLVHELNDLDVWITMYEHRLHGPAES